MNPVKPMLVATLLLMSCSGLTTLTPEALDRAEASWKSSKPSSYRLVVSMEGDRVERGEFEVVVNNDTVSSLKRNGREVQSARGQDYSMDGLFNMIHEEMGLAEKPALLGAPEGYSAYLMARFDAKTGRLMKYRRAVGGATNSIDIAVLRFEPQTETKPAQ